MSLVSVKGGCLSWFSPTRLVDLGTSTVKKIVQFTCAFFQLIGLATIYRGICSLFSSGVKKEKDTGAGILNDEDRKALLAQIDAHLFCIRRGVNKTEIREGGYFGGADFREIHDLRDLQAYLARLGFSALCNVNEDSQSTLQTKVETSYTYSQARLAHEMAKLEATKAIATCPLTKGCHLSFVFGGNDPSVQLGFNPKTIDLSKDPLDAAIFSWTESSGVQNQLNTLLRAPDPTSKHLFIVASQLNGTEATEDLTPRPGMVMKDSESDNTQGPKAQRVRPEAQRVRPALFELINWGLGCLGYNAAIKVLDSDTYVNYRDGYLIPRSIRGLNKLVEQFQYMGGQLEFPYIEAEEFDVVLAAAPDLHQEIFKYWSENSKDLLILQMYQDHKSAANGGNDFFGAYCRSNRAGCATQPLTYLMHGNFANFQANLDKQCTKRLAESVDALPEGEYKQIIEEILEARSSKITEEQYQNFKKRLEACDIEPLGKLYGKEFWEVQAELADPNKKAEYHRRVSGMPNETPQDREKHRAADSFLNKYCLGLKQEEYKHFQQKMESFQYWAAYTSFVAQFNGMKQSLQNNPDKKVVLHLTGVGMGAFGNQGEFVAKAFHRAAKEFDSWIREKGLIARTKVVYEAFARSPGDIDNNSVEFIRTLGLKETGNFMA